MNALQHACDTMESGWQVQMRTGDTDAKTKQAQKRKMPEVFIILESLHVPAGSQRLPGTVQLFGSSSGG